MTGAALLQRAGFTGENKFDALQIRDIELADGVIVVERFDLLRSDPLYQPLLKRFLGTRTVTVALHTLSCGIVQIERQVRGSTTGAVMPTVHSSTIFLSREAATADARPSGIAQTYVAVKRGLSLILPLRFCFQCYTFLPAALTPCLLLFTLALLLSTQILGPVLRGLRFGNGSGTLVAADHLSITDRVEPLTATLVCALTAGFLSHAHPQTFWRNVRGVGSRYFTSCRSTLTVQVR